MNKVPIHRYASGLGFRKKSDFLAPEEPLEIQVDTRPIAVTMRTPGHDEELALGFLVSEGLLTSAGQVRELRPYPRNRAGNALGVFLRPDVTVDLARLTRHVFASSSCGVCGKASIDAVRGQFPSVAADRFEVAGEELLGWPDRLRAAQPVFAATGGLHAAGLFSADGELRVVREDVGRHNAVDKVLGHALRQGWLPLRGHVLLVSGRASFEILQKALAGGIAFVAAVSAPSDLAVRFARESAQTLVGFLREEGFNVYSGRQRIEVLPPGSRRPPRILGRLGNRK